MRKFFERLKSGLSRTRAKLGSALGDLFLGKKQIDDALLEALETHLLTADVGIDASNAILSSLTDKVKRRQLNDSDALFNTLKETLHEQLAPFAKPLQLEVQSSPFVLLVVGINGSGKTTTIGKLAKQLQAQGMSVMLAAGDTFRAAAVEQLQVWGERNQIPVVAQHTGADSASVIYDALAAAKARNIDVVIADTAGRLHTQSHLMEELKKVKRVIQKFDEQAPHETLLVLDASIGQNALVQAETFHQAIGVSGIALTKLDGTARGGMVFAITEKCQLPIRYIGVGEGIDDLQTFEAQAFIDALIGQEQ